MKSSAENSATLRLTVEAGGKRELMTTTAGKGLLDVLRDRRIYINAPCGGKGTCGKCRIKVLAGTLEVIGNDTEAAHFVSAGETVLACRAKMLNDCTIEVGHLQERNFAGTADFAVLSDGGLNTELETLRFSPPSGCWSNGRSITETICTTLGRQLTFTPKALRQLSFWMGDSLQQRFAGPDAQHPIYLTVRRDQVLLVRTSVSEPVYGIGVDIGTTTIAFALVDLESGKVCNTLSLLNSQRQYGADVISRIQKSSDGLTSVLRECSRSDITRGLVELCGENHASVVRVVIAGNTTMLHLLLGLRSDSLAQYPFNPVMTEAMKISATELLGPLTVDCEVTLLPSASAFMGADIIVGLVYCQIDLVEGISLFIDVGTNGEMAIGGKEKLICVSTAAGPAFEGANITWGTGSIPGAVSSFDFHEGKAEFSTIGDAIPVGICGSAVVDIVAACLRTGIIDRTGRFISDETGADGLPIAKTQSGEWIKFFQKDVREFQLAKSAIRSGIEILMREYGCRPQDIGHVYLAGGFGTRMNAQNALAVGLFPPELQGKIQSIGNTSLGGTVHCLLNDKNLQTAELLAHSAIVIDLSRHPSFNDLFMEQLQF